VLLGEKPTRSRLFSRTRLPDDILDLGFTVLRGIGRGKYALEVGGEAVVHMAEHDVFERNDQTPLPVRLTSGCRAPEALTCVLPAARV
jgi:hypothetical protein